MIKLKLALDSLTVDTFDTAPGAAGAGTVVGNSRLTADVSCQYSCDGTCDPPCRTGYPDGCWISWDPAARCIVPPSAPPC